MLEKIRVCLAHPKFMGRFVVESTWKPVVMLLVMFLLLMSTFTAITYSNNTLSTKDEQNISMVLLSDPNMNLTYDSNTNVLSGTKSIYGSGTLEIQFFSEEYKPSTNSTFVGIHYYATGFKVYLKTMEVKTVEYSSLNLPSFSLDEVRNGNIEQKLALRGFIQATIGEAMPVMNGLIVYSFFSEIVLSFLMVLVLCYLFGGFNPAVKGIFKFRLILYSMMSYFFFYWISIAFNLSIFSYISLIVPFIYFVTASKNIVKINPNKKG